MNEQENLILVGNTFQKFGVDTYLGIYTVYGHEGVTVNVYYKQQGADDSTYTTQVPTTAGNYVVKLTLTIPVTDMADVVARLDHSHPRMDHRAHSEHRDNRPRRHRHHQRAERQGKGAAHYRQV